MTTMPSLISSKHRPVHPSVLQPQYFTDPFISIDEDGGTYLDRRAPSIIFQNMLIIEIPQSAGRMVVAWETEAMLSHGADGPLKALHRWVGVPDPSQYPPAMERISIPLMAEAPAFHCLCQFNDISHIEESLTIMGMH